MVPIPELKASRARRKVLSLEELAARLAKARAEGRRVVLCHGVFDLLHIGHIRHFEAARRHGDLLVATVTPDRHVNKGPHRPAFPEALRAEAVAALDAVDYAAVSRWPTAVEPIRLLKPGVYAKGADYRRAGDDATGGIRREAAAVRAVGGRLVFTDDLAFSSSHLLNRRLSSFPAEVDAYLEGYRRRHSLAETLRPLEAAKGLKVLVVGEAIVDEYVYCDAIGKSSKEPTLVVRREGEERFAGGALAVANHAAAFAGRVTLLTLLGDSPSHEAFARGKLRPNVRPRFLRRPGSPTIVKRRFVERYHFTKLLEVYEINDALMEAPRRRALRAALERELGRHDLVIVADYGHGMLDEDAAAFIARKARRLAVNAQSNAGNLGYHAVDRYPRADLACLTEAEMRMESRDRRGDLRRLVPLFSRRANFPRVIVTRGSNGCLAWSRGEGFREVPAFAGRVRDRVGAGDAFLSVAALCDAAGAPLEVTGLVGNAAGAQAVAVVGNREPLDHAALLKHVESLLK
ncbi:MAG: adenylyltransferase/cytidyltransferase family protein [Elusimicrobia bacterium]|nr:adenylyltransferase/cytidyltransferase family protein [Elusimicrobiota bacterium]